MYSCVCVCVCVLLKVKYNTLLDGFVHFIKSVFYIRVVSIVLSEYINFYKNRLDYPSSRRRCKVRVIIRVLTAQELLNLYLKYSSTHMLSPMLATV